MADDPRKHAHDRKLVSLKQRHERRHWTRELGVTLERLKFAVASVGPSAKAVRAFMIDDQWAQGVVGAASTLEATRKGDAMGKKKRSKKSSKRKQPQPAE